MRTDQKYAAPGITVRFPPDVREQMSHIAKSEHRSAAAYVEHLVALDLRRREEEARAIHIYIAADAPEWTGTVDRGEDETLDEHADRTTTLNQLFGNR